MLSDDRLDALFGSVANRSTFEPPSRPPEDTRGFWDRTTGNYDDLLDAAADKHGIDRRLVRALRDVESSGNPQAVSPKGALGLMQVMPGTAREMGYSPRDMFDPAANIDAGVGYLGKMLDRAGGDTALALRMYNAGPYANLAKINNQDYADKVLTRVRRYNGLGEGAFSRGFGAGLAGTAADWYAEGARQALRAGRPEEAQRLLLESRQGRQYIADDARPQDQITNMESLGDLGNALGYNLGQGVGSTLPGALGYAGAGAALGSMLPGVGTGVGGLLGLGYGLMHQYAGNTLAGAVDERMKHSTLPGPEDERVAQALQSLSPQDLNRIELAGAARGALEAGADVALGGLGKIMPMGRPVDLLKTPFGKVGAGMLSEAGQEIADVPLEAWGTGGDYTPTDLLNSGFGGAVGGGGMVAATTSPVGLGIQARGLVNPDYRPDYNRYAARVGMTQPSVPLMPDQYTEQFYADRAVRQATRDGAPTLYDPAASGQAPGAAPDYSALTPVQPPAPPAPDPLAEIDALEAMAPNLFEPRKKGAVDTEPLKFGEFKARISAARKIKDDQATPEQMEAYQQAVAGMDKPPPLAKWLTDQMPPVPSDPDLLRMYQQYLGHWNDGGRSFAQIKARATFVGPPDQIGPRQPYPAPTPAGEFVGPPPPLVGPPDQIGPRQPYPAPTPAGEFVGPPPPLVGPPDQIGPRQPYPAPPEKNIDPRYIRAGARQTDILHKLKTGLRAPWVGKAGRKSALAHLRYLLSQDRIEPGEWSVMALPGSPRSAPYYVIRKDQETPDETTVQAQTQPASNPAAEAQGVADAADTAGRAGEKTDGTPAGDRRVAARKRVAGGSPVLDGRGPESGGTDGAAEQSAAAAGEPARDAKSELSLAAPDSLLFTGANGSVRVYDEERLQRENLTDRPPAEGPLPPKMMQAIAQAARQNAEEYFAPGGGRDRGERYRVVTDKGYRVYRTLEEARDAAATHGMRKGTRRELTPAGQPATTRTGKEKIKHAQPKQKTGTPDGRVRTRRQTEEVPANESGAGVPSSRSGPKEAQVSTNYIESDYFDGQPLEGEVAPASRVLEGEVMGGEVGPARAMPVQGRVLEGEAVLIKEVRRTLTDTQRALLAEHLGENDLDKALSRAYDLARDVADQVANQVATLEQALDEVTQAFKHLATKAYLAIRKTIRDMARGMLSVAVAFNFNVAAPFTPVKLADIRETVVSTKPLPAVDLRGVDAGDGVKAVATHALRTSDGRSYIVLDKPNGALYAFDGQGKLLSKTPALTGLTKGDVVSDSAQRKHVDDLTGADRITPAGRFSLQKQADAEYKETLRLEGQGAIKVHRTYLGDPKEKREQRLATPTPADNRISYGCINVPAAFYDTVLAPHFQSGSYIFVMPDTVSLDQAFGPIDTRSTVEERADVFIPGQRTNTAGTRDRATAMAVDDRRAPSAGQTPVASSAGTTGPQYSRTDTAPAKGTTASAVKAVVKQLTGRDSHLKVVTHANRAAAEQALGIKLDPKAKAFVLDGRAHFILDRIAPGSELGVFLHEVGAHLGMEKILTPAEQERLHGAIERWAASGTGVEKAAAQAALKRARGDKQEAIAYFVEEAVNRGVNPTALDMKTPLGRWFRQVWAAFKRALRTLGVNPERLTARDVVDLAYGAAGIELRPQGGRQETGGPRYANKTTLTVDGVERPTTNSNGQPIHPTEEGIRNFWRWFGDSKVVDEQGRPLVVYRGEMGGTNQYNTTRGVPTFTDSKNIAGFYASEANDAINEGRIGELKQAYISAKNMLSFGDDSGVTTLTQLIELAAKLEMSSSDLEDFVSAGSWIYDGEEVTGTLPVKLDRFYDKYTRSWVIQAKDVFNNQIGNAVYVATKKEALSTTLSDFDVSESNFLPDSAYIETFYVADSKLIQDAATESGFDGFKYKGVFMGEDFEEADGSSFDGVTADEYRPFHPAQIKSATGNTGAFSADSPDIRYSLDDTEIKERILNVLDKPLDGIKEWLIQAHKLPLLAEWFPDLPALKDVSRLEQSMQQSYEKLVNKVADRVDDIAVLDADVQKPLFDLMLKSTLWRIHPDEGFQVGRNAHLAKEDQARHAEVQAAWDALDPKATKLYGQVRDLFEAMFDHRQKALQALADQYMGARAARRFARNLAILRKQSPGPYFPLIRFGEHVAVWKSKDLLQAEQDEDIARLAQLRQDENHYKVSFFDSQRQAKNQVEAWIQEGGDRSAPPGSPNDRVQGSHYTRRAPFIRGLNAGMTGLLDRLGQSLDTTLGPGEETTAAKNALAEAFLSALPDNAIFRSAMKRESIAGVKPEQMLQAIAFHGGSQAFHISRLEYADAIQKAMGRLKREDAAAVMAGKRLSTYGALSRIFSNLYANDEVSGFAKGLQRISTASYYATLATKPSFWFINAITPATTVIPWMTGKQGITSIGRAYMELGKAMKDVVPILTPSSISDYLRFSFTDAFQNSRLSADEKRMLAAVTEAGAIDQSQIRELTQVAQGQRGKMDTAMRFLGGMAHRAEVLSRAASALTAYRMEKARTGSEKDATAYAIEAVNRMVVNYSTAHAPLLLRKGGKLGSPAAKMIFQYARYPISIGQELLHLARRAKGGDAEATRQFWTLLAVNSLLAGTNGWLGAETLKFLVETAVNWFLPDDDELDIDAEVKKILDKHFGKSASVAIRRGPLALIGVDLSESLGFQKLFNVRNESPFSAETKDEFALKLMASAPAVSWLMNIYDFIQNPDAKRIPIAGIANVAKALEQNQYGMVSRSGVTKVRPEEYSAMDIALQGFGLMPTINAESYAVQNSERVAKKHVAAMKQELLRDYHLALKRRDGEQAQAVLARIRAFQSRHPGDKNAKIDSKTLRQSERQRRRREESMDEYGVEQ